MEVADECDDPNAIHQWCRFKREVIKKPNYYKNHFSLTEEYLGIFRAKYFVASTTGYKIA